MTTRHIESFLWEAFDRVAAIPFFGDGDDGNTGHYHYHGRTDDVATVIPDGSRQLAEEEEEEEDGAGGGVVAAAAAAVGVDDTRISYEDLYASLIFVMCVYASGMFVRRALRMPPLVGEIFAGVLLGPNLAGYVPFPVSFVMLGELGLLLLLLDAGVTVDLPTLRLVGYRGLLIAIVGSMLPISVAFGVSLAIGVDVSGSIAAGACFGPTSAGIAMSTLKRAGVLESPVGQLIVCAAVIDDMIALVVLSQLNALVGDGSSNGASSIIVPIASALGFLTFGGAIAVRVLPPPPRSVLLLEVRQCRQSRHGRGGAHVPIPDRDDARHLLRESFVPPRRVPFRTGVLRHGRSQGRVHVAIQEVDSMAHAHFLRCQHRVPGPDRRLRRRKGRRDRISLFVGVRWKIRRRFPITQLREGSEIPGFAS